MFQMAKKKLTAEDDRLAEANRGEAPWKKWGPYLSERQWGTVREDYSENGDAWNDFTHDQARERAEYYFESDNGAGLGASHQTGWTGLVARMIQYYGSLDAAKALAGPERTGARVYRRT